MDKLAYTKASMPRKYAPNRIKLLRTTLGFTLEELGGAMASELTASTVAKLENSRRALSLDYLNEIADALGVSPMEIIGTGAGVRYIPIIKQEHAENWRGAAIMNDMKMAIPGHIKGDKLFAIRPDGDSMDRIAPSGDEGGYVVVDPEDRELRDGKYYVVLNNEGEVMFRQFCAEPLSLVPASNNPGHQPITLGESPFQVIGRMIHSGRDL